MQRVSVVLLTRNEEALIGRALASARAFADEIMLIDSNSTDRTKEIAEAAGATVYNQDWLGWVGQRRKAASLARNDWLFFLEADEIVTPELAADIRLHMAGDPEPGSGFTVERKDEFLGRLMFEMRRASKRAGFVRLYNRTRSDWRSDMLVHEELACPGPLVRLKGSMLHWRNYAIADQIATYNRYSELEMREMLSKSNRVPTVKLVVKPFLRFLWVYVKCGHWRLGVRGFIWSCMNAFAEFLRLAKAWEHCHAPRMIDPPKSLWRPEDSAASATS
jgi:glycosyltransferase involved in cell wall biosynthesis